MSTQDLSGKVIAITGAASGIGLATAHYLAKRGVSLSLADIAQKNLESAIESITTDSPSAKVIGTVVDVSKRVEVEAWMQKTLSHLGKLDGAANLAAIFTEEGTGIVEMSDSTWDSVISINLTGLMYCLRAQLKAISEGGSIVNATSVAGMVGSAQFPAYSTSKHGVIGLTKSAAREAGSRSVRVNMVCP
jgi:NAD(P)-dependent dehydrogenase (short-subunit alcohol dehydrogenase family)